MEDRAEFLDADDTEKIQSLLSSSSSPGVSNRRFAWVNPCERFQQDGRKSAFEGTIRSDQEFIGALEFHDDTLHSNRRTWENIPAHG